MRKIILFCFTCLSILLIFKPKAFAANLITNPGFEIDDTSWVKNTNTIDFTFSKDEIFEGTRSAKIVNTKTSSFGIEQTILNINPALTYAVSAFIKPVLPIDKAYLRIAWYKSPDGSGSQFTTDDSFIASPSALWQKMEIIKQPPDGMLSAKIRLLVATGSAYFDNVYFDQYIVPLQTPTATPTPSSPVLISPTIIMTPIITTAPSPTTPPVSYDKIYLSEVMVNPDVGQKEWVEIYNDNDFDVVLTNWFIDDLENAGSTPKLFTLNIKAKGYAVFDLTSSIFNNDGDSVRLLDFNKKELDSFEYATSQKGKSLGRVSFDNDSFCLQEPTKGLPNAPCLNSTSKISTSTSQIHYQPSTHKIPSPTIVNPFIATSDDTNLISPDENNFPPVVNEAPIGQVLGEQTDSSERDDSKALAKSLSFASASYSLLTIVSLLLRIKFKV